MKHTFRYLTGEPLEPGRRLRLSADDSHHLVRVVRRRPGDAVELIDPAGRRWRAAVTDLGPPAAVEVVEAVPGRGEQHRPALYLGLAEWGRIDIALEKAVELGAGEVTLFVSERAGRVPAADAWARRAERLGRLADAAARQCGRAPLGGVRGLVPFAQVIAEIPSGEGFLIDPRGDAPLLAALGTRRASDRTALVVGPQAGFSDAEVSAARAHGIPVCTLGDVVLRAETAAIAALALATAAAGAP